MQRYSYNIAIRVWHPSISPDEITLGLGFKPNRSWKVGQKRSTPKGTPLEGAYRESYWNSDPFQRGEYSSTDDLLEDSLTEILEVLEQKKEFLQKLRSDGGRIILQISSFSGRNYAFELSPDLLGRCAATGVSIAHEVYPYAQNW